MAILEQAVSAWKTIGVAVYGGAYALISGLILVTVGDVAISEITTNQWLVIGLSILVAGGGAFGLSNTKSS